MAGDNVTNVDIATTPKKMMALCLIYLNGLGLACLFITKRHLMKVIIFAKTISVNLAVENRVINVITIFENSSGNESQGKSIMEEPLNSAKPRNKLNIKDNSFITTVVSSMIVTYRLQAPQLLLSEQLVQPSPEIPSSSIRPTYNGTTKHSTKDGFSILKK